MLENKDGQRPRNKTWQHKEKYCTKSFSEEGKIFDQGSCMKGDPVKIHLRVGAKLYCATSARRIPLPILPKEKKTELERLEGDHIIQKVTRPTHRCVGWVTIFKGKK